MLKTIQTRIMPIVFTSISLYVIFKYIDTYAYQVIFVSIFVGMFAWIVRTLELIANDDITNCTTSLFILSGLIVLLTILLLLNTLPVRLTCIYISVLSGYIYGSLLSDALYVTTKRRLRTER